jgi:hypothetical protein
MPDGKFATQARYAIKSTTGHAAKTAVVQKRPRYMEDQTELANISYLVLLWLHSVSGFRRLLGCGYKRLSYGWRRPFVQRYMNSLVSLPEQSARNSTAVL